MSFSQIITCLILVVTVLLNACSSTRTVTGKLPPINAPSDDASIKLAEAANSISRSLIELNQIQAAATPAVRDTHLPSPTTIGMQTRASVDWSGPIAPLLKKLAFASQYHFRVLGKEPAIPVLVSISAKDATVAHILRDIGFQVQIKAKVIVYPHTKTIELRYAPA